VLKGLTGDTGGTDEQSGAKGDKVIREHRCTRRVTR